MKIVINDCYGGFGLSPKAIKRLAELNGKECYFFKKEGFEKPFEKITIEEASESIFYCAFNVPNPNDVLPKEQKGENGTYLEYNKKFEQITNIHFVDRTDLKLIQVVEELGKEANGLVSDLKIVEIPDGIEWEIDEYDGIETIEEKHRSWS